MEESFKITFKGKTYLTSGFPTVGKFYDVEATKQLLSMNTYSALSMSSTQSAQNASQMIAMEAYFSIFFPELIKDLKVPFRDLGLKDFAELRQVYKEQFLPQYNAWIDLLSNPDENEKN